MSEDNSTRPKQYLLYTVLIILTGIAGLQTWYMLDMKHRMDAMQGVAVSDSPASTPPENTTSAAVTAPDVAQLIDEKLNAQAQVNQAQANQQRQQAPSAASSLFDNDFFNQPFADNNWNPYEEIERMQRHMDRVFNNAFSRFGNDPDLQKVFHDTAAVPEINVTEDGSQYTVTVNLPGADEKNISVNLEGQQLTVKGQQNFNQQKKDASGNVVYQQHSSGMFQRSITLPQPVNQNGMVTHVDKGILTITVPKVS